MTFILDDNSDESKPDENEQTKASSESQGRIYSTTFKEVKVVPVYRVPGLSFDTETMEWPSLCGTYILIVEKTEPKFTTMNDTGDVYTGWY